MRLRPQRLQLIAVRFLTDPPRFLFFTGKGGVGKTSLACATALQLVDRGKRVLLVSTDPASNVAQVLGTTIGNAITPIPAVPGLSALEIDPEEAADAYRERIIGPVRGLLPDQEIASITEQLSGSCTTEVASFDEFTDLLADPDLTESLRPRPVRHRPHRTHHSVAAAPWFVDRLSRSRQGRCLVSWAAGRA